MAALPSTSNNPAIDAKTDSCFSNTPLGLPVDPDVYMMTATWSGVGSAASLRRFEGEAVLEGNGRQALRHTNSNTLVFRRDVELRVDDRL